LSSHLNRQPELFRVSSTQLKEAIERARKQEKIYGHNTGHFTLKVEKENTIIGVLGEVVVRDFLEKEFRKESSDVSLEMCPYGAEFDLELNIESRKYFLHVKSGLWKKWPLENWHFGIHADQGIQNSASPLILVSFLKSQKQWPEIGRIEGVITSELLRKAEIIKKGQRFPSTGVVSRTENILTTFSEYQNISLLKKLFVKTESQVQEL